VAHDLGSKETRSPIDCSPSPGSKLAEAKKYGVDLTLLVENLSLTPTERAKKLSSGAKSLRALRLAGERYRSKK
jgi:hypothetical protein